VESSARQQSGKKAFHVGNLPDGAVGLRTKSALKRAVQALRDLRGGFHVLLTKIPRMEWPRRGAKATARLSRNPTFPEGKAGE
jgi:hypothetical protein